MHWMSMRRTLDFQSSSFFHLQLWARAHTNTHTHARARNRKLVEREKKESQARSFYFKKFFSSGRVERD